METGRAASHAPRITRLPAQRPATCLEGPGAATNAGPGEEEVEVLAQRTGPHGPPSTGDEPNCSFISLEFQLKRETSLTCYQETEMCLQLLGTRNPLLQLPVTRAQMLSTARCKPGEAPPGQGASGQAPPGMGPTWAGPKPGLATPRKTIGMDRQCHLLHSPGNAAGRDLWDQTHGSRKP